MLNRASLVEVSGIGADHDVGLTKVLLLGSGTGEAASLLLRITVVESTLGSDHTTLASTSLDSLLLSKLGREGVVLVLRNRVHIGLLLEELRVGVTTLRTVVSELVRREAERIAVGNSSGILSMLLQWLLLYIQ